MNSLNHCGLHVIFNAFSCLIGCCVIRLCICMCDDVPISSISSVFSYLIKEKKLICNEVLNMVSNKKMIFVSNQPKLVYHLAAK